jgi:hypothetical protein
MIDRLQAQLSAVKVVLRVQEDRMSSLFARRGSRAYPAMVYTSAVWAALDHPEPSCEDCGHDSDCATHNAPALTAGACDCTRQRHNHDAIGVYANCPACGTVLPAGVGQ